MDAPETAARTGLREPLGETRNAWMEDSRVKTLRVPWLMVVKGGAALIRSLSLNAVARARQGSRARLLAKTGGRANQVKMECVARMPSLERGHPKGGVRACPRHRGQMVTSDRVDQVAAAAPRSAASVVAVVVVRREDVGAAQVSRVRRDFPAPGSSPSMRLWSFTPVT